MSAADHLVDEATDLRDLFLAAKSERLRRVLGAEMQVAFQAVAEQVEDLKELRALRAQARRATAQKLLDKEIRAMATRLERAEELLEQGIGDGVPVPTPRATPGPEAPLPDFVWRSPYQEETPALRLQAGDANIEELMRKGEPFIITGSRLCGRAVGGWSPEYLQEHFGEDVPCTVYQSTSREFQYWDLSKNKAGYDFPAEAHTAKLELTMRQFHERACRLARDKAGPRVYLQTPLVEGVGKQIVTDFLAFDWAWVKSLSQKMGWGHLTSNLLLVGMEGNVTTAHFDEQQNLLAQLIGRKRVLLWRPRDWPLLYPHPEHHPHDRQTQVDFSKPDLDRFPRFAEARAIEAVLQPGDVLFIPQYWWHHVENVDHSCVSVNFWYRDTESKGVQLPLTERHNVALRRNMERILAEAVGHSQAHAVFKELGEGPPKSQEGMEAAEHARKLLANIFDDPETADDWLRELCAHRFW